MFLSKELFEPDDGPPGASSPPPLGSLPTPGAASSSSSAVLGAGLGTPQQRPGSSLGGGGRPTSSGSLRPGDALDDMDDQAAPTGAAALRQKMLQQRQRTLQKRHSASNITSNPMVMANESLPAEVTSPAGGTRSSPLARPGLARPGTAGSLGSGISEMPMELRRGMVRSASSASSAPMSPLSGRLSADEYADPSGVVMPEPLGPAEREEEARRRNNLAQELDERGICPVYDPTPGGVPRPLGGKEASFDIGALSASELKPFLLNPSPKHAGMIECRIIRERTGLNKLFPKYTLESDAGTFLLSAKKQTQNKTSNYAISMSKSDVQGKDSDQFLGKLRSNFLGLEFTAYGTGLNPKKIDPSMAQAHAIQLARQELIGVQYSSSLWGAKPRGPRKMSAVMPRVQPNGERLVCRTLNPETEGLLSMLKAGNTQVIEVYQNKPPKWNEQIGAFVLNFNKRVTMARRGLKQAQAVGPTRTTRVCAEASVKNFQLTTSEDPDTVYLQFGRVGKDEFNMDFRHPFSPFQAFAVCLSSFDYKLCCE